MNISYVEKIRDKYRKMNVGTCSPAKIARAVVKDSYYDLYLEDHFYSDCFMTRFLGFRKKNYLLPTDVVTSFMDPLKHTYLREGARARILQSEIENYSKKRFSKEQLTQWLFGIAHLGLNCSSLLAESRLNEDLQISQERYFENVKKLIQNNGRLTYRDLVKVLQEHDPVKQSYSYIQDVDINLVHNLAHRGIIDAGDHSGNTCFAMGCSWLRDHKGLSHKKKYEYIAFWLYAAATKKTGSFLCSDSGDDQAYLIENMFDIVKSTFRKRQDHEKILTSIVEIYQEKISEFYRKEHNSQLTIMQKFKTGN